MPPPQPYTTDTSDEAFSVQMEGFRRMAPAERIQKVCQLSSRLRDMARDAIRRRYPQFDEAEVNLKFIELTYGRELATAMRNQCRDKKFG